jgi:hypothetical protein
VTLAEVLASAIRLDMPLATLREALRQFPWDCDAPLVTLQAADVVAVIDRFLDGELSPEQVVDWADLLEARDDVEFGVVAGSPDVVKNAIWLLANPEINLPGGVIARDSASAIRGELGEPVA